MNRHEESALDQIVQQRLQELVCANNAARAADVSAEGFISGRRVANMRLAHQRADRALMNLRGWVEAKVREELSLGSDKAKPTYVRVAELPKHGKILARSWHRGISTETSKLTGCWSHPVIFTWDETNNYWGARREGMCIRADAEHRFMGFPMPDDPRPPIVD